MVTPGRVAVPQGKSNGIITSKQAYSIILVFFVFFDLWFMEIVVHRVSDQKAKITE